MYFNKKIIIKKLEFLVFISLLLIGCSTKNSSLKIIHPKDVEGPLNGYIEIIDEPYTIEFEKCDSEDKEGYISFITLKIKIKKPLDFEIPDDKTKGTWNLGLLFFDKLDSKPMNIKFGLAESDYGDFKNFLKVGYGIKKIKIYGPIGIKNKDQFISELQSLNDKVSILTLNFDQIGNSINAFDDKPNAKISCNQLLARYEKIVENYFVVLRKYQGNTMDRSMMPEYVSLMCEIDEWNENVEDCAASKTFATKIDVIKSKLNNISHGL